ncbi:hypothetical protein JL101_036055 (plasmid) [Skermanella rosea]|uniref:hypothetical protein n=1 Tax=Skermanella rosea TaxID=1817965 RepID=UPI001931DA84|nr:hypothetical protein [Skermanella rosea]UEM08174.1 hypothetical protein JL101_036055 [Skermanella rosea]
MILVFRVHFHKEPGMNLSVLRKRGVWAEMVKLMRERDPSLERATAYNANLQRLGWETSQDCLIVSEPTMLEFQDRDDCGAFVIEFFDHIRSIQKGEYGDIEATPWPDDVYVRI